MTSPDAMNAARMRFATQAHAEWRDCWCTACMAKREEWRGAEAGIVWIDLLESEHAGDTRGAE
jgi:hypothetical protein